MKSTVLKAATCTQEGAGTNTCTRCGHSESCTYEKLDHDYKEGMVLQSTCATEGSKQMICTVCGKEQWYSLPEDSSSHTWFYYHSAGFAQCIRCGKTKSLNSDERSADLSLVLDSVLADITFPVIGTANQKEDMGIGKENFS